MRGRAAPPHPGIYRVPPPGGGPRTVPCGTPEITCFGGDETLSQTVCCVLCVQNSLTNHSEDLLFHNDLASSGVFHVALYQRPPQ